MKNKSQKSLSRFLVMIGLLLIAAALLLIGYNVIDERRASSSVKDVMTQLDVPDEIIQSSEAMTENVALGEVEIPDHILNPAMDMPETNIGNYDYIGVLEIPPFEIKLPVISDWSYPALRVAPCRYEGSAYTDDLVISAHNYRSHFGCLKSLPMGTEIRFTDLDGNVFLYEVMERGTLNPEDVDAMVHSEWDLTLFTCTVGGQYRVTVRCERIEE